MIGIDWGTSRVRAFRLDPSGRVATRVEASRGVMTVPPGEFPAVLRELIGGWLAEGEHRVLMSGMVGSRQGWVEAPYLPCPASPADVGAALVPVPFAGAQVLLVPGLSDVDAEGTPEVMRGEETQIAGVLADLPPEALVCLPGSHSKWARISGTRVASFRTYLSGEAFSAIRAGTILGRMMPEAPHDDAAFDRGVARAGESGHLLHHLFGVRTLGLTGRLADPQSASYLSGLLIGHEVNAALRGASDVHLVGSAALTALYARAIASVGARAVILGEDAAATGLAVIGEHAPWD